MRTLHSESLIIACDSPITLTLPGSAGDFPKGLVLVAHISVTNPKLSNCSGTWARRVQGVLPGPAANTAYVIAWPAAFQEVYIKGSTSVRASFGSSNRATGGSSSARRLLGECILPDLIKGKQTAMQSGSKTMKGIKVVAKGEWQVSQHHVH